MIRVVRVRDRARKTLEQVQVCPKPCGFPCALGTLTFLVTPLHESEKVGPTVMVNQENILLIQVLQLVICLNLLIGCTSELCLRIIHTPRWVRPLRWDVTYKLTIFSSLSPLTEVSSSFKACKVSALMTFPFNNASIQVASTPTKAILTCIYLFQLVGACLKIPRTVLNSKTFKICEMRPINPKRSRWCQKAHMMHRKMKKIKQKQKIWIFWLWTVKGKGIRVVGAAPAVMNPTSKPRPSAGTTFNTT